MAVFITGGLGHIGSWCARLLAQEGRDVIVYDTNDETHDYLDQVAKSITFIKGDVLDFAALEHAFERHRHEIDGIIHTVGVMGELVQRDPHYNVTLNVMGLVNVLELARLCEIPKVLYTSSGAVYGAVEEAAGECLPPAPADLYAATKVSAEHIGVHYGQAFGIDFRVARVYFVYGPGKRPSRFIRLYQMAFGALEGMEGLRMDRGAQQRLDFTYVEDAARGIELLFGAQGLRHKIFNIASGKAHAVGEAARLAQTLTHFPVKVDIGPGELMRRCETLDIGRARTELGYGPRVDLQEGIKRYADWLKDRVHA
jgi:nucleoside-diphosphate-sugar epimerase